MGKKGSSDGLSAPPANQLALKNKKIVASWDGPSPPPLNQAALNTTDVRMEQKGLIALRAVLKADDAQWKSAEQRRAVVATLKRESDVIAMLKTGGGKSMLAILPAVIEMDKAVVVVLPLKSLMTDWERKLS